MSKNLGGSEMSINNYDDEKLTPSSEEDAKCTPLSNVDGALRREICRVYVDHNESGA